MTGSDKLCTNGCQRPYDWHCCRVERLGPGIGIGAAGEAQEAGEAQDSSLVDCDMADRHMAGRSNYAARPATPTPATSANLAESETGTSVSGPVVGWAVPGDLAIAAPRRRVSSATPTGQASTAPWLPR